jgi:cytosine/adenosine deaminase-related metal-dependent hydrolase
LGGADAINAGQVLDIATRGGAQLLGWSEIGTLEPGKAADIAIVEMNRLDYAGALSDPLAAVIFSGISHQVHTVLVNGQIVVQDGRLLAIDEEKLCAEANRHSQTMMEKAGCLSPWME